MTKSHHINNRSQHLLWLIQSCLTFTRKKLQYEWKHVTITFYTIQNIIMAMRLNQQGTVQVFDIGANSTITKQANLSVWSIALFSDIDQRPNLMVHPEHGV